MSAYHSFAKATGTSMVQPLQPLESYNEEVLMAIGVSCHVLEQLQGRSVDEKIVELAKKQLQSNLELLCKKIPLTRGMGVGRHDELIKALSGLNLQLFLIGNEKKVESAPVSTPAPEPAPPARVVEEPKRFGSKRSVLTAAMSVLTAGVGVINAFTVQVDPFCGFFADAGKELAAAIGIGPSGLSKVCFTRELALMTQFLWLNREARGDEFAVAAASTVALHVGVIQCCAIAGAAISVPTWAPVVAAGAVTGLLMPFVVSLSHKGIRCIKKRDDTPEGAEKKTPHISPN